MCKNLRMKKNTVLLGCKSKDCVALETVEVGMQEPGQVKVLRIWYIILKAQL